MHYSRTAGFYALLLWIVGAGAWLRLRNLGADSIWLDEAVSWTQSKGTLIELVSKTARDNYPPLHNLLLYAFMNVSGTDTEWVLRLPSAILGIANIAAIYWLGSLVRDRISGLLAAALLAVSTTHIYYSQEARMYSLLALATTLYAAAALFFVRSPSRNRAVLVAACGVALLYSHPFGTWNWLFIAGGITAGILLAADFPRAVIVQWRNANAAIGLAFLPWAIILFGRSLKRISQGFWVPYPTPHYVYDQLSGLAGGDLAMLALVVAATAGLLFKLRTYWPLLAWIVGPIAAGLVISLVAVPIFVGRYLIGSLPALLLLAALGMAHLACRPAWSAKLAAAFLLVVAAAGNLSFVQAPRGDWRTAAAYLDVRLKDSDCVLVYPAYQAYPLNYYLRQPYCTIPSPSSTGLDLRSIGAERLFAVLVDEIYGARGEVGQIRRAADTFGSEGESLVLRNISIVEYKRKQ